ncbi:MAG: aspartate aminotransferase family protein [Trueperaceae bacterium]|nr:MAG: aspartate aminotransferase family protein [Trueperaceae bacterium]
MGRIRLVGVVPGPRSRALVARREAVGARGAAKLTDLAVERAHGAVVVDVDGNELLDFAGGIGALAVGHTPAALVRAVQEQAERLVHMCAIVGSYEPYVALLERLVAIAPGDHAKKAVLMNSGSEAVETAVNVARAATGRAAVLVFEGAYHGRTNLALAMTSKYGLFKKGFGPFAPEVYRAPYPDTYRRPAGTSADDAVGEAIRRFDHALLAHVDPSAVAAVVIEPVQGEGGFVPAPAAFLRHVRERCTEHGMLLIADEVQCGMGRTGRLWAVEHAGVVPDLLVTAKSLGGGMPIAAVIGRAEVMDAPHPGGLGGTYSGNPLACVAALAAIDAITAPGFLERARAVGERMRGRLEALAARHACAGEVRGLGPMLALELVHERTTKRPHPELVLRTTQEALRRGLIVIRAGLHANCLRLLPPLDVDDATVDEAMDVLGEALAAAAEALGHDTNGAPVAAPLG